MATDDTTPLTGDAEAESVEESQAGQAPVPIADAVMQLLRVSHHFGRELKPLWDEAQRDGLEGEPGVPGPPGAGANKFATVESVSITAGLAINDVLFEGEIPASSLPDRPFWWYAGGSGEGGFFASNIRNLNNMGQIAGFTCQVHNQLGVWTTWGNGGATLGSLPPGIPTLFRFSPATGSGSIANLMHHFDPTTDTGIPFRLIVGSVTTLVVGQFDIGLQVELVVYA